jgi:hypothetical protein
VFLNDRLSTLIAESGVQVIGYRALRDAAFPSSPTRGSKTKTRAWA